ncbi:TonB-dependent receptor domain-containing protein [Pikeienuella sp. HZG-20]|uniref:TonB-dependent receptor domain-containing protein n=1 Tax=Paludibacillus litoralis TaxID=3133267 RepID=UPI0030EDD4FF
MSFTRMGLAGCVLAAGSIPGAPIPAAAQQADEAGAIVMPEITVFGGARDERALLDTPNAVSVLGVDEIERRQASTYEELIGDLPGVTIDGGPRGASQEPNIRGFQDEQVVLRVDGARQTFNLAHRGRFFTDPLILKNVEVLKGGASTLFGSGALGGVIFLDTKDADDVLGPDETRAGEFTLGYNSQGDELLGATTVAAREGDLDILGFISARPRFSDQKDGAGDAIIDSDIDSFSGLLKLGWNLAPGHRIEAAYQRYQDRGDTPPNTNVQGSPTSTVDRDLTNQTFRLGWDWDAGDGMINLKTLFYYNKTDVEEDRLFDGRFDESDFETIGFEATNISRFDLGLPVSLSYGVEAYRDRQEATRDGATRAQTPDADQTFLAAFAQAEIGLTPELTLIPGMRLDHVRTDPDGPQSGSSDLQASPKLALSWRPAEGMQFFASASRSFRSPSLTELYPQGVHFSQPGFPLGPGATFTGVNQFVANPDLKPEKSLAFEFGGRYETFGVAQPSDRLTFSANAYYARVDDFIEQTVTFMDFGAGVFNPVSGQFEVGGTTTSRNVDAELFGLEAQAAYDAGDWFLGLGLTLPRGSDRNGGELASLPQDRLVATGGFRPMDGLEIGARATLLRKLGPGDLPVGVAPVDGAAVFDVFATYAPAEGPFKGAVFHAGVDNVTDKKYRVHPSGLNSLGIAAKLSATLRF